MDILFMLCRCIIFLVFTIYLFELACVFFPNWQYIQYYFRAFSCFFIRYLGWPNSNFEVVFKSPGLAYFTQKATKRKTYVNIRVSACNTHSRIIVFLHFDLCVILHSASLHLYKSLPRWICKL